MLYCNDCKYFRHSVILAVIEIDGRFFYGFDWLGRVKTARVIPHALLFGQFMDDELIFTEQKLLAKGLNPCVRYVILCDVNGATQDPLPSAEAECN
jgi:hypothetical protein